MDNTSMNKISGAVLEDAGLKCKELAEMLEEIRRERLDEAEEQVLKDAYDLIQAQMAVIENEANKAVSMTALDNKKRVVDYRIHIAESVFGKVKEKLEQYCRTDEYTVYLMQKCESYRQYCAPDTEIHVREQDMERMKDVLSRLSLPCQVCMDDAIVFGGFIMTCAAQKISVNETFDEKLCDQMDSFEEMSALKIV